MTSCFVIRPLFSLTVRGRENARLLLLLFLMGSSFTNHLMHPCQSFYLPGVNPHSYREGEVVRLNVNKLTSSKTLLPIDYYKLPFCQPEGGPKIVNQNLGEFLEGDRISSSPYHLEMKKDMYCQQLCVVNLGRFQQPGLRSNKIVRAIQSRYHHNWILDNLPSAFKTEDDTLIRMQYGQGGFPVGFLASTSGYPFAYINNHVNIEIQYHSVETEWELYRIVRFTVEPFSIKHDFEFERDGTKGGDHIVKIKNPIESCVHKTEHTNYDMVTGVDREPQLAGGMVLFTYDVIWIENRDLHWASRWDIYLSNDWAVPGNVHWLPIFGGLVTVFVLSGMVVTILIRNIRRDLLARYVSVATNDEQTTDTMEDDYRTGWKATHADVFRPPTFSPRLLSVCCGTGAQLLCTTYWWIIFSLLGFLNPSRRGHSLMFGILIFVCNGGTAGYVTARFYKTFKGKGWLDATIHSAMSFPGLCFSIFLLMNFLAVIMGSSLAVPFVTLAVLAFLWLGIYTPLNFLGAYVGFQQKAIALPMKASFAPRDIPDQPAYLSIPFTALFGGLLPFAVCFTELSFLLDSLCGEGMFYYVYGFALIVFLLVCLLCAEVAIFFNYFHLCHENYHWWWRSFGTAGSLSAYVFLFCFVYFLKLGSTSVSGYVGSFATYVLYFGYVGLASLAVFLMTGFIGLAGSLWFNIRLFSSIQID